MTKKPKIDGATMVAMACRLGPVAAMDFAEFARSLEELDTQQTKMLLRGWLAIESMPNEASLEIADLRNCLRALRQSWIREKHKS